MRIWEVFVQLTAALMALLALAWVMALAGAVLLLAGFVLTLPMDILVAAVYMVVRR